MAFLHRMSPLALINGIDLNTAVGPLLCTDICLHGDKKLSSSLCRPCDYPARNSVSRATQPAWLVHHLRRRHCQSAGNMISSARVEHSAPLVEGDRR
jgi:hypothetical protein